MAIWGTIITLVTLQFLGVLLFEELFVYISTLIFLDIVFFPPIIFIYQDLDERTIYEKLKKVLKEFTTIVSIIKAFMWVISIIAG
ncbi:MAG: hypothetical protein ACTSYB_04305 [Candidatus Helarchaeota archaeon]